MDTIHSHAKEILELHKQHAKEVQLLHAEYTLKLRPQAALCE
jgi:hypothetical protein